jgi:hypothetical protein
VKITTTIITSTETPTTSTNRFTHLSIRPAFSSGSASSSFLVASSIFSDKFFKKNSKIKAVKNAHINEAKIKQRLSRRCFFVV